MEKSIILQNIYFDFDKYELLKESYPQLDLIVKYLEKNSNIQIAINGHTDNIGTTEYNYELSSKRAQSVVEYLLAKGITSSRLKSEGFGYSIPLSSNETKEGRHKNRRIEMKILNK